MGEPPCLAGDELQAVSTQLCERETSNSWGGDSSAERNGSDEKYSDKKSFLAQQRALRTISLFVRGENPPNRSRVNPESTTMVTAAGPGGPGGGEGVAGLGLHGGNSYKLVSGPFFVTDFIK